MSSAMFRIVISVALAGVLGLQIIVPSILALDRAEAATMHERRDRQAKSKHSSATAISITSKRRPPAIIQNLRTSVSPELTRLVLDLDRKAPMRKPVESPIDGVVIEIPHATLSPTAQKKIATGVLPDLFIISQESASSVSVALPPGSFETYRLFTLTNPHRLVIDVVPPSSQDSQSVHDPAQSTRHSLPPSQPVPPPVKSFKTIVIDPGHGGKDPGTHGRRGTEEKDITLKVGLKLRDLLRKEQGYRVLMTRDRDVFVELEDRANFANTNEADLFISIHVNSHPQRSVRGIEIYHFGEAKDQRALEVAARENGTPLNSTGVGWEYLVADLLTAKKIENSLDLAWNTKEAMITHLNGHYALVDHGVKTAPFYVLRFTSMPSILAEIAYLSNSTEEQLLRNNTFLNRVAASIREGLKAYLESSNQSSR